jgi:hypothetical protein
MGGLLIPTLLFFGEFLTISKSTIPFIYLYFRFYSRGSLGMKSCSGAFPSW